MTILAIDTSTQWCSVALVNPQGGSGQPQSPLSSGDLVRHENLGPESSQHALDWVEALLDEAQLTDVFDHDLASGKLGRKYDRRLIAQAIDDPITGESFYVYHIPYGFSSDMTYNSGSIAFQTLNNPVLNVTVDVGSGASRPFEVTGDPAKEEFELVIMHNYFNMMRIDSNTGAITRSLDL